MRWHVNQGGSKLSKKTIKKLDKAYRRVYTEKSEGYLKEELEKYKNINPDAPKSDKSS